MQHETTGTRAADSLERIDFLGFGMIGFVLLHLGCLALFQVEFSWAAVGVCLLTYTLRAFGITVGFHRGLSHRAYKTSRVVQFLLAWLATSALQRGPLWWVSHHRHHHPHADAETDVHSPHGRGFWWSHMGWVVCRKYNEPNHKLVTDLARLPEMRWLDRYFLAPPLVLVAGLYVAGAVLARRAPELHTSGLQFVVYGFLLSTVLLYHATFSVNSVAHLAGRRRFAVNDQSRNNVWVALLTLGEGWHNNHHFAPSSARLGFRWWEFDPGYYGLRLMNGMGLIWDMKTPPAVHPAGKPRPAESPAA
jgi:stearoyl-CoA desaturase (Delta-9 desaturase)